MNSYTTTTGDSLAKIFVSYSSKDKAWVQTLVTALQTLGWEIWWDLSLRTGARFARDIEQHLDAARCVIVVWSMHSVDSQWVEAEAMAAQQQGKLIPVRIDGCTLPLIFRPLQTLDLNRWSGDASAEVFQRLATDIARTLGTPAGASEAPTPVARPADRTASVPPSRSTVSVADGITLESSKAGNVTGIKSEAAEELPEETDVSVLRKARIVDSQLGDISGIEIKKPAKKPSD